MDALMNPRFMVPPLTVELGVLLVRRGNERRPRFLYSSPFGTAIVGAHRFAGDATDTDRKINPGPPAQRFMKPPLSRYIALAQRRTMGARGRKTRPTSQIPAHSLGLRAL